MYSGATTTFGTGYSTTTANYVSFGTSTGHLVYGLTYGTNITSAAGALTFTPTVTGTLNVTGGGTGASTFTSSNLLYGAGSGAIQSVATTSLTASGALSLSQPISVIGSSASALTCAVANGSTAGCLSSTDWNTFNGKVSFAFPFTTVGTYVATSTAIDLAGGFFTPTTASSTLAGAIHTAFGAGSLAVDSTGLMYSGATTTFGTG